MTKPGRDHKRGSQSPKKETAARQSRGKGKESERSSTVGRASGRTRCRRRTRGSWNVVLIIVTGVLIVVIVTRTPVLAVERESGHELKELTSDFRRLFRIGIQGAHGLLTRHRNSKLPHHHCVATCGTIVPEVKPRGVITDGGGPKLLRKGVLGRKHEITDNSAVIAPIDKL